jgi:hypothetical protein
LWARSNASRTPTSVFWWTSSCPIA